MAQDRCPVLSAPSPRVPITAAERARPSGLFGFHDHHARTGPVVAAGLVSWRRRPWPGLPARRLRLPRRDRIRSRRLRPRAPLHRLHRLHRRRSQLRRPGRSQPGSHNDRIGVAPAPLPELPPTTHIAVVRAFSLTALVTQRDAGTGTQTLQAAASSCPSDLDRTRPTPPRRSGGWPSAGATARWMIPGWCPCPAPDCLRVSRHSADVPAIPEPVLEPRRHPDVPAGVPAARPLHRDQRSALPPG